MTSRLFTLAAVAVCLAGSASAQLRVNLSVGYEDAKNTFDNDGDRNERDKIAHETLIPVNLGIDYSFFAGLYAGADLSLLYRSQPRAEPEDKSAFGVRELDLHVGWEASFVVDVAVDFGFKLDLGKHLEDVDSDKLTTSDNQHAFHVGGGVGFSVLPMLSLGARVNLVLPLEREVRLSGGIKQDQQNGVLVDTAVTLGGSVAAGPVSVLFGVDLGFLYQGAKRIDGDTQKINGDDVTSHVLHLLPMVGVGFGSHRIKVLLAAQGEDAMVGIPLTGKNFGPFASVPVTFNYTFQM